MKILLWKIFQEVEYFSTTNLNLGQKPKQRKKFMKNTLKQNKRRE